MKGFTRREPLFSLCGLKCGLCRMHLGGYCPGCGGGEGNQSCAIARCSLEHGGPEFCWDCPEYPCARYEGFDECDSFVPHSARARNAAEARSLGIEAYMARMRESAALLAARLLTEAAQARGLSLKLVKNHRERKEEWPCSARDSKSLQRRRANWSSARRAGARR